MSTTSVGRLVARLELAGDFTERMMEASKALSSFSRRLKTLAKNAEALQGGGAGIGTGIASGAKKAEQALASISQGAEKARGKIELIDASGPGKLKQQFESSATSVQSLVTALDKSQSSMTRAKAATDLAGQAMKALGTSADARSLALQRAATGTETITEATLRANQALAAGPPVMSKSASAAKLAADANLFLGDSHKVVIATGKRLSETTATEMEFQQKMAPVIRRAAKEQERWTGVMRQATQDRERANQSLMKYNSAQRSANTTAAQSISAIAKLSGLVAKLAVVFGWLQPAIGATAAAIALGVRATAGLFSGIQKLIGALKNLPKFFKSIINRVQEFAKKVKKAFDTAKRVVNALIAPIKKVAGAMRSLLRTVADAIQKFMRFTLVLSGVAVFGSVTAFAIRGLITKLAQAVGELDELGRGAASLQFVANSFRALAGNFNRNGSQMIGTLSELNFSWTRLGAASRGGSSAMLTAMQKASFGMSSNAELMEQYNMAAQLLGSELAHRFPDALRLLTKQSMATGMELDKSMDSFISGVGRLSLRFLDNIGVTLSLEDAYAEYAETVGKTADQLTEAERRTAAFNATIEKLEQNMANIPSPMGTAVQVFGQFDATVQNLKDSLGTDLLPGLVSMKKAFVDMAPTIEKFLQGFAGAFRGLIPIVREVVKVIARVFGIDMDALAKDSQAYGENMVVQLAQGMINGIAAVMRALITLGNLIRTWLKPGSPPKLLPHLDDWGTGAAEAWAEGWTRLGVSKFKGLARTVEQFLRAVVKDNVAQAVLDMRMLMAKLIKGGKDAISVLPPAVQRWATAFMEVQAAMEETRKAQDRLNEATARYQRLLKPIERELGVIEDRRFAVAQLQRAVELQRIVNDQDAPELAKQLALMELREIQLRLNQRQIESAKDAEVGAAEDALSEAEKQQKAAEDRLQFEEDILEALIDNLNLMREIADAAKSAAGGGAGAVEPPEIMDELGGIGSPIGSFESSVSDLSNRIEKMFKDQLGGLSKSFSKTWIDVIDRAINGGVVWERIRAFLLPKIQALWTWVKGMLVLYGSLAWFYLQVKLPIWAEAAWEAMKKKMIEFWETKILPVFEKWKEDIKKKILDWVSPVTDGMGAVKTGFVGSWLVIKFLTLEVLRGLFAAMGIDFDKFIAVWNSFGLRMQIIWRVGTQALLMKALEFGGALILWVAGLYTKLVGWWKKIKKGIVDVAAKMWGDVMAGVEVFWEGISKWFEEKYEKAKDLGRNFFQKIGDGMMEIAGNILSDITIWVNDVLTKLEELLGLGGKSYGSGGTGSSGGVTKPPPGGSGPDRLSEAADYGMTPVSQLIDFARDSQPSPAGVTVAVQVDKMTGNEADLHKLAARVGRAVSAAR